MRKGRVGRGLAMTVVGALFVVAPLAGVAAAGEAGGSGDGEVVATLKIAAENVSVQKAGKGAFKPAKDGQKLRQGDSVQTDATGRAEIDYGGDSYTRLDVNTTFTIAKLTEEQGARQIEGSLENGRTWNRAENITESGSFEQSGGGATAAVTGTAFPVDCTVAAPDCLFTGVEGTYVLKGNAEERTVLPFQQCGSTDGELCEEVRTLTADEMAAILWIQDNLLQDLIERGLGNGPVIPDFTVVVVGGEVVEVIQEAPPATEETTSTSAPSSTSSSTTSTSTTTTTLQPPGVESPNKVTVHTGGSGNNPPFSVPSGPLPGVTTEDEVASSNPVEFTINVTGASGHTLMIRFTQIVGTNYGKIYWSGDGGATWSVTAIQQSDVDNGTLFPGATLFRFEPEQYEPPSGPTDCQTNTSAPASDFDDCFGAGSSYPQPVTPNADGTVQWETSFKVKVVDTTPPTTLASDEVEVPITIIDDICGENANRGACVVVTSTTVATVT